MKRLFSILLCAALLAGLFGCGNPSVYVPSGDGLYEPTESEPGIVPTDPEKEQELTLVYYPDNTMNPYKATDFTNRALFSLLYQGLFAVTREYEAMPILCESYSVSKDMKTYTFRIAPATFSDGAALTVEDVVASLQAAQSSSVYKGRFTQVRSIYTADDGSLVISLSTPYENLPLLLDVPIVKASDVAADQPLGTGPYMLENSIAGLRLRRRSNWWCAANLPVTASYISLTKAESPSQIRDEFQFSDVGLVCADPGSDTYADFRSDYELWDCENGIFLYIGCNLSSEVFANATVRAALTHAIDRDLLVNDYYRGFARSACLPASPLSPWYNQKLAERYGYDPEVFLKALEHTGLQGKTVTFLVNSDDTMRIRAARAISKMLTDCGLVVKLSELGGSKYRNALKNGQFDLYLGQTKLSPNMDLSPFFTTRGALNYGAMADAALQSLCWDALANSGNYYTLHQTIMADGRLVPILFRSYAIYTSRGLFEELDPARDNIFYYDLGKSAADVLQ